MRGKAEKWGPRNGCTSRVNGEMEVDRDRLIWELLSRPCLEHASEVWLTGGKVACKKLGGKNSREHWQETGGWE